MAVTATGAPAAPQQSWRDREYDLLVLADAAFRAGWRDRNQLIQALAVSLGEWGGTPKGGHNAGLNADGSVDYDAWQVNGTAHPWYDTTKLGDPYYAAWAAFRVWEQAGRSWSPWVAWTRGKAQQYIDDAAKIVDEYLAGGRAGGVQGPAARKALTPVAARRRAEQVVLNMIRAVKESARPNRAAADADASLAAEGAGDGFGEEMLDRVNEFLRQRRPEIPDPDEEVDPDLIEGGPIDEQAEGPVKPSGMNGRLDSSMLVDADGNGNLLQPVAASSWQRMVAAAAADGVELRIGNSYRSYDQQVAIAAEKGLYSQGGLAAVPGTSNHGWGLAVDIIRTDAAVAWLRANASRFGWRTIAREPWHWEYVGGGS